MARVERRKGETHRRIHHNVRLLLFIRRRVRLALQLVLAFPMLGLAVLRAVAHHSALATLLENLLAEHLELAAVRALPQAQLVAHLDRHQAARAGELLRAGVRRQQSNAL